MNKLHKEVLNKFAISLVVALVGMVVGDIALSPLTAILIGFLSIPLVLIGVFVDKLRESLTYVYIIIFLLGMSIYPIINLYVSEIGAAWVVGSLLITILLFGGLATYAYLSKRDFGFLGTFLTIALLALIGVSIISLFINSTLLTLILAYAGVMIFSGYVLYDVSQIKNSNFSKEEVPWMVLKLFLDFINLFLDILRIIASLVKD
ncbi:Bax inhibitor-1/YccA family protein [Priestia aryabhattai]|uniref:Bax inhibitor-1/YccA family protein n=1 Tax=Priestia aryabhattai TaxID=412384 RepID=UPI0015F3D36A|nr:Bax inhibitor-1/YccA family protein [Priestia aryabhattai]